MAAIHRWIKDKKESQMTMLKGIAVAALVLGPTFAFAATPGYLDGYYIADSKLKLEGSGASADDNGDGFGLRVRAPIGDAVFVVAEYQTATVDNFAGGGFDVDIDQIRAGLGYRSEEHTSELQSLMRISYAVFCLKKKKIQHKPTPYTNEGEESQE